MCSSCRLIRFMSSLSFPDINVWLALLVEDHRHRSPALGWWRADQSDGIAFSRLIQIGVLRVLTTAAAMNDRPLRMAEAWSAHDHMYLDYRVVFLPEPTAIDRSCRQAARSGRAPPKL